MPRFDHLRRLTVAALATLGIVVACRAAAPREAPPLAPRPDRVEPAPTPVPKAPSAKRNPLKPSGKPIVVREIPTPDIRASGAAPAQSPPDAGTDTLTLDPVPDAVPTDARKTPETLTP